MNRGQYRYNEFIGKNIHLERIVHDMTRCSFVQVRSCFIGSGSNSSSPAAALFLSIFLSGCRSSLGAVSVIMIEFRKFVQACKEQKKIPPGRQDIYLRYLRMYIH